jgi:hypothetical protein
VCRYQVGKYVHHIGNVQVEKQVHMAYSCMSYYKCAVPWRKRDKLERDACIRVIQNVPHTGPSFAKRWGLNQNSEWKQTISGNETGFLT